MSHAQTQPATTHTGHNVEVVATFGDEVVGVRHVADPKGGIVRGATKALIAGGAALLASAGLAFGYAAHVADENAAALERWTAAGKPAWAFRPVMVPRGLDAVMLGGSVLGLAALTFGLSRRRRERRPAHVRIGTSAGVDFACEGAGAAHALVAPAGDGFVLQPRAGMTGELLCGTAIAPLGDAPVPLGPDTRARVRLGKMTFHVGAVPAPAKAATSPLGLDSRAAAFLAGSAAAHIALIALLRTVPDDQSTAAGDDGMSEYVLATGETSGNEEPVVEPDDAETGNAGASTGEQARMTLESGTMGADAASPDPGRRKVANDGPTAVSRRQALERAKEAGILGSSYMNDGDLFASIVGAGDLTSGFDDLDQIGGWDGDGPGAPSGFGNGPTGWGPGGGGNDWSSVWSGNYNTISVGPGGGDGYNLDGPGDGSRRRKPKAPPVRIGEPTDACRGSAECDPEIIRRYIKRNASKIAYCYERQLLATPGLAGTVQTVFTVMPNGRVMNSSASGVHEEVSSCIADVISNIKFPKFDAPFLVKYPFHLRPAGS